MELKEGYMVTEVGVIPEDWTLQRLDSLGKFSKGQGINKDSSQSGNLPCVRYGELYTRHDDIIKQFFSFISVDIAKTATKIKKGDILFAGSGETKEEIGKCAALVFDVEAYAGGDIVIFSPTPGLDSRFLGYLLNSKTIAKQKASRGQGDAVVHISAGQLKQVLVPVPRYREQTAIANALSDVDDLISSLEKLIEKKKRIKEGAMQQLLQPKEGWVERRLGEIVQMKSGVSITSSSIFTDGRFPCFGGNGLRGFCAKATHHGDYILIGRQGALCGNVKFVTGSFFASEHAVVVSAGPLVEPRWLYYVLQRMNLNQFSESSAQPGLSVSKILMLSVQFPSIATQKLEGEIIYSVEEEIFSLEKKLTKYKQIKQGMMQNLLTGKIRLVKQEEREMEMV